MIVAAGSGATKHFSSYHRLLSTASWPARPWKAGAAGKPSPRRVMKRQQSRSSVGTRRAGASRSPFVTASSASASRSLRAGAARRPRFQKAGPTTRTRSRDGGVTTTNSGHRVHASWPNQGGLGRGCPCPETRRWPGTDPRSGLVGEVRMPGARPASSERRAGCQSCSARPLPSETGRASACHASARPTRPGVAPYHLAGRSLRPSRPPLTRICLRSAIHGSAGQIRRLNGRGNPWPPFS